MTKPLHPNAEYTFATDGPSLFERMVIITGVGRSGTTLTGNLIGSFRNVEYDYESWPFHCIPMMFASAQISKIAAGELLRGYCTETLTAAILGRNINVRPTDDSRIWNRRSEEEISFRWQQLNTREDVKDYIQKNQSIFCLKAINLGQFLGFLYEAFPGVKIINVVRHPFHVAASIHKKGWMNLERLKKVEGLPIRKRVRDSILVPWWVEEERLDEFFQMDEYARALYGWRVLTANAEEEKASLGLSSKQPGRYLEFQYEELLRDPAAMIEKLSSFAGAGPTPRTKDLMGQIDAERSANKPEPNFDTLPENEKQKLFKLMDTYGYAYGKPSRV